MSQTQNPKANFMQTVMIMITVFLAFQVFTGGLGNNKPADTRPLEEIEKNLLTMSTEIKDISIQHEISAYDRRLGEEENLKKITSDQRTEKHLRAVILGAHAALTGGMEKNEIGRVQAAWTQLDNQRKNLQSKNIWTQEFSVPANKTLPDAQMSASELYQQAQNELSNRNKSDLVLGFIPGWELIDFLVGLTGRQPWFSYTFGALLLALVVRALVFPLAQKQLMASKQMMQLQPLLQDLKKKHTNKAGTLDQAAFQADTMNLYKEYGVNPFKGCGPALVQLPLFLLVFQCMMHYRFEFSKGYMLWVNPATSAASHGFFAPNLGVMDYMLLGVYGICMVVNTLLQPVNDPSQLKQQRTMGVGVSIMATVMMFFYPLPSAFVVYWIFLLLFSTAQSLWAYRLPVPPLEKVQTSAGGVAARSGFFQKLMEQQQLAEQLRKESERQRLEEEKKQQQKKPKKKPGENDKAS